MSLKGTNTEQNLLAAFAGESQARNRYTYFASQAQEGWLRADCAIFEETANQEKEHAKRLFSMLKGGDTMITATFPAGVIGSTLDNLQAAAAGENHEWTSMYPEFADIAKQEGFKEIAAVFSLHRRRREAAREALPRTGQEHLGWRRLQSATPVRWVCRHCGLVHEGVEAPKICPACGKTRAYFEVDAVNY